MITDITEQNSHNRNVQSHFEKTDNVDSIGNSPKNTNELTENITENPLNVLSFTQPSFVIYQGVRQVSVGSIFF